MRCENHNWPLGKDVKIVMAYFKVLSQCTTRDQENPQNPQSG